MRRRSSTNPGPRNCISLPNKKLDRIIFPSAQEYKESFDNYVRQKGKLDKTVYLKFLKGLEDEITQSLTKMKLEDEANDFLLVRLEPEETNVNEKVLFWKNLYYVNYSLGGKQFVLNYPQFETATQLIDAKNDMMVRMKEIFKNAVKFCVYLKEKSKTLDHNISKSSLLGNTKRKELEKLEKQFQKISTSKKYINRSKSQISKVF